MIVDDFGSGEAKQGRPAPSGTRPIRVLLVEDEFLVGMLLEEDLREEGFVTIGPMTTLDLAFDGARREPFDVAILDINLCGEMVYPLADELAQRDIPFMFLSGYVGLSLPERFVAIPRLGKPYQRARLVAEIRRLAVGDAAGTV